MPASRNKILLCLYKYLKEQQDLGGGGREENTFLFINSSLAHTSKLPLPLFCYFPEFKQEIFKPTHRGLRGKRPLGSRGHCNWEEHVFVFLCEGMHAHAHMVSPPPPLPFPTYIVHA